MRGREKGNRKERGRGRGREGGGERGGGGGEAEGEREAELPSAGSFPKCQAESRKLELHLDLPCG